MIVFLNEEENKIYLYTDNGKISLDFKDVNKMYEYIGDSEVYYITNAVKTNIKLISNLIEEMGVNISPINPIYLSNKKYIHSISNGTIIISEDIKFNGKYDIKEYDKNMKKNINNFPLLKTLIEKNKIEIIGEAKRQQVLKEFKKEREKQKEKIKKSDEKQDSIILKKSVADYEGMDDIDDDDDDNTIDMTNEVVNGRDNLTDNEQIMKMLGIK